jgi:hypothetical protein
MKSMNISLPDTMRDYSELDPWTQRLIGVINLESENTV